MKKLNILGSIALNEGTSSHHDSHITPPDNLLLEENFEYSGDNVDGEMFDEQLYSGTSDDSEQHKRAEKINGEDFAEYSDVFEALV